MQEVNSGDRYIGPLRAYTMGLIGAIGLALVGCHDDSITNPSLDAEPPLIQRIVPEEGSLIGEPGSTITFSLEAADDKGLARFQVFKGITTATGESIRPLSPVLEEPVSGRFALISFTDTLDVVPTFSRITYTFAIFDKSGKEQSTTFFATVVESPTELVSLYGLFVFDTQMLRSGTTDSLSGYNFTTQAFYPGTHPNPLSLDIREVSTGDTFLAQLRSPNNDRLGKDSVFVMASPLQLNYGEANYEIMSNVFRSADSYLSQTPGLKKDDLLIIRLTKAPFPQYALMHILSVQDLPGSSQDYLEFEYKVSSE